MTSLTHGYTEGSARTLTGKPRSSRGGPRLPQPSPAHDSWFDRFNASTPFGSHMPLDTDIHWHWSNPINIIPALIALFMVIALIAAMV